MGPAAEGMAVAIAQSDLSGPSVDVVGAGAAFRERVALQLARLSAPDDLAAASRSRPVAEDRLPQALEPRHLMLVPPFQQAFDRPAKIDIHEILTAWRTAERALAAIPEGSPDWARIHARVIGLRAAYHELFAERCDRPPRSEAPLQLVDGPELADGLQSSG